jgi:O-antigen/teichoic acid export membrane protein
MSTHFLGHARSINAKKNIIILFLVQGAGIAVNFLLVRVSLDYLDPTKYGIWITITSLLTWFSFFDIGLGNGLKNKLAIALAKEDYAAGRMYLSTTYAILSILILCVAIFFFSINKHINWPILLNTNAVPKQELSSLISIVFGFFFLRFVFQIINSVLNAAQQPATANFINLLINSLSLILIFLLAKTTEGSLIYLGLALSSTPFIVMMLFSIYFYSTRYKFIAPDIKFINFSHASSLLTLGVKFFLIQIAGLIIYSSGNLIIGYFFGPAEVTPYSITYKYYSLIYMLFSIITTPFWVAFTDAWAKQDIIWIKLAIKKLVWLFIAVTAIGILMFLFSDAFFSIWLDNQVKISFELSFSLLVYFVTTSFGNIFASFINGVGKIKMQLYGSYIAVIVFILTVLVMIKVFNAGVISIVIGMIASNLYGLIVTPIQTYKLIHRRATGIWNE